YYYGYKCCQEQNTKVRFVDKNGKWGVENGEWCGIVSQRNNWIKPWKQFEDMQNFENSSESEEDQDQEDQKNIEVGTEDYMSKLQVVNICPDNYRKMHEGVEYPTVKKITYYSKVTETEREMNIAFPVGYDENKKYPVLYFLHGLMHDEDAMLEDESSLAIPTNLLNEGRAEEMIIVFPDIYAPEPGTAVEPDYNPQYYLGYDNFINEIADVIMPYMAEHYPVLTGRENTAICGFSMGARASLHIGYMRSDLFGYVGSFAPAPGITPGEDSFSGKHPGLISEDEFRAEVPHIVSLIDCGTNDTVVGQFPKSYHEILTRNNQEHIWFEVPGADHDWNAISAGLYNFVQTLFGALNN
ncbi:carbohydrate esterase family 1 protein, partial [Piromyces sp. E2]